MGNVAIFKGKLVKFLAKAGILVPARGDMDRSGIPAAGETAFNTDSNKLEVYNGTTWAQLEPSRGNGLVHPSAGTTFEYNSYSPSLQSGATQNTAIGSLALSSLYNGTNNTAIGYAALQNATISTDNIAIGPFALQNTTASTANYNIAMGSYSLYSLSNLSANYNVGIGFGALTSFSTGNENVAIGSNAGSQLFSGNYNTFINSNTNSGLPGFNGVVNIGKNSSGLGGTVTADNDFILGTISHRYKMDGIIKSGIKLGQSTNDTSYVTLQSATTGTPVTWTLPVSNGNFGDVLTTNGSGTLSWLPSGASIVGPIYSRSATGTVTKIYGKIASDALVTRAISSWTTKSYWPTTINANSVCWSPELSIFVSVGSVGTNIRAATSTDGSNWTFRTTPESNTFNSVCWSPALGIFCAVSSTGTNRVMTSPDGINWTARAASSATQWKSVSWSPELGLFAAVAASSGATMYSSDGITWAAGTGTSGSFQYFSIVWSSELGLFVALGPGTVATSSNGTSWTETSVASITASVNAGICWSPELGIFSAVTDSGVFATSTNGTTWTIRTSPAGTNQWTSIAWSSEFGIFCASAITGTGTRIATSVDGITWTLRSYPTENQWRSICWSPELGIFCAVSSSSAVNNGAMVSRDVGVYRERKVVPKYFYRTAQSSEAVKVLRTWTQRSSAATNGNNWYNICWSPELNIFVAVGDGANSSYVATSSNGIDWTTRTPSISPVIFTSVCWSAELNLFVAVASVSSVNAIMTSPDGITWTTRSQTTASALESVTWSSELKLFVAIGTNKIISSPDGIVWTDRTSPANRNWRSVVWSPETGQFCAVAFNSGVTSTIMTSSNGVTWTLRNSIDTNGLVAVSWSSEKGIFIATTTNTASNHFAISYDGISWVAATVSGLTTANIDGAALWCPELGVFVATSYASVYVSIDGISWALIDSNALNTGFNFNWIAKAWSAELGQFVFLTNTGAVNPLTTSRKSNLLSEILNLRTSRLY